VVGCSSKIGGASRLLGLCIFVCSILLGCGGGGGGSGPAPVTISSQPSDQSVVTGSAVTLSIAASGDGLSYQWQSSTDGGITWANIAGATAATYSVSSADSGLNSQKFRVVVTGAANSVTSSAVTLTVGAAVAPAVTVQPTPQTTTVGANATFSVTATGTSLTYQWQASIDGGLTWADISAQTTATLTLNSVVLTDSSRQVRVIVSNGLGSVTSTAVALTVNASPVALTFTTQPAAISVVAPATATFTAAAIGTPSPSYQWQVSIDNGTTFTDIAGATSASYTTAATTVADSDKQFRVVVINANSTATSNAAILNVTAATVAVSITNQPANVSVTAPATATFSVVATGAPTPTYQWQVSINGGAFANISDATAASYTTPSTVVADNGKLFRVVVTNSAGPVNSAVVALTVNTSSNASGSISPVTSRRMGEYYSAASGVHKSGVFIKADGSVVTLGSDSAGSVVTLAGISNVSSVDGASGVGVYPFGYNIFIRTDGGVLGQGWVNGLVGGLGKVGGVVGTTTVSNPTVVSQLTNIAEARVLGGSGTVVARKSDGTIWLLAGSLNISSVFNVAISAKQVVVPGVVIALGDSISNINGTDVVPLVTADGSVQMVTVTAANSGIPWTTNMGDYTGTGIYAGNHDATYAVSKVQGLPTIVQVSCEGSIGSNLVNPNQYHCLALTQNGSVWSWGGVNSDGQLGNGTTTASETPFQVSGLSGVIQVKAGPKISVALAQDGSVYSWGYSAYIGRSISIGNSAYSPGKVVGIPEAVQEVASNKYNGLYARGAAGSVWAWGLYFGVADGKPISINLPEKLLNINMN
jgi:hypothetical protein